MKAIVIATGRVVDVVKTTNRNIIHDYFGYQKDIMVTDYYDGKKYYTESELEFDVNCDPDYWTRLEHQAAVAAMQGILSNPNIVYKDISTETICNHVAERVKEIAHALVEKLKEKEERK